MSDHLPLWAQWVQAVATFSIALFLAWLAWRQAQIARTRLQIDLYEKRHGTFDAARALLEHVSRLGTATDDAMRDYALAVADAAFLFDDNMARYLKEIWGNVVHIRTFKEVAEPMPPGEEKAKYMSDAMKRLVWVSTEIDGLSDKFKPWLRLEQRGSKLGAWWWK